MPAPDYCKPVPSIVNATAGLSPHSGWKWSARQVTHARSGRQWAWKAWPHANSATCRLAAAAAGLAGDAMAMAGPRRLPGGGEEERRGRCGPIASRQTPQVRRWLSISTPTAPQPSTGSAAAVASLAERGGGKEEGRLVLGVEAWSCGNTASSVEEAGPWSETSVM